MTRNDWYLRTAWVAAVLTFFLVVLGAFVRLSDAGLGCPDWPVCYGKLTWPGSEAEIAEANRRFPERPVETTKAWREQAHRMVAGMLGLLTLALAFMAAWPSWRRRIHVLICAAVAALATILYVAGYAGFAGALSVFAIGLPLAAAWRWRDDWRARFAMGLFGLIVFQAMLGMWTVTWLLKPVAVVAHLLGGMATLALFWLLALRGANVFRPRRAVPAGLRRLALAGLVVLGCQIALGGWTSSNYAALACPDVPTCQGQWWPDDTDFAEAFVVWRGLGVDYEGGVLEHPARVAIHLTHRVGAVITGLVLLVLAAAMLRAPAADSRMRMLGGVTGALVLIQIGLGIATVHFGLPLALAVGHNATAAVLLLSVVAVLRMLYASPADGIPEPESGG